MLFAKTLQNVLAENRSRDIAKSALSRQSRPPKIFPLGSPALRNVFRPLEQDSPALWRQNCDSIVLLTTVCSTRLVIAPFRPKSNEEKQRREEFSGVGGFRVNLAIIYDFLLNNVLSRDVRKGKPFIWQFARRLLRARDSISRASLSR